MNFPQFVGPFDTTLTRSFNCERTINWYPEQGGSGAKSEWALMPVPGLRLFSWFEGGPARALFAQDGRAWGVAGSTFGEISSTGGPVINQAVVANDGLPASIASNGTQGFQVMIVAGGLGYIFDTTTNTTVQITDAEFPAGVTMVENMDTYFIVLVGNTRQFWISELANGLVWSGLDVFERSEGSDNIQALVRKQREIWLLGSKTTEVWFNTGDANTPFAPLPGVFIEQGCIAPWTARRVDNTIFWLGQNELGFGVVYRANGWTPLRISTFAVEQYLAQSSVLSQTQSFSLLWKGHLFYGLIVPDLETSIVYDVASNQWMEFARWNIATSQWIPYPGNCSCAAFNHLLIGDRGSGAVYRWDETAHADELASA